MLVLHFQGRRSCSPLANSRRKVAPTLRATSLGLKEAQRWVGVGGQQMHRDGGLHLSEIILTNLGARLVISCLA